MSTDQIYSRLYDKKLLSLEHMSDKLLSYLISSIRAESASSWRVDGVFDAVTPVTPGGNNQISMAAAFRGASGNGRTFVFGATDSRLQNVKIPPAAGTLYDVALEQTDVDNEIEINPRNGQYEYKQFIESVGRKAQPALVVDNGNGTITFTINSNTFNAGEDHSGRRVMVWLKSRLDGGIGPLAATAAAAFETLTVVFTGGVCKVTTAGNFGQGTVTTDVTKYWCMAVGPTVRQHGVEDLTATVGALFMVQITTVTAGNPIPGGNINVTSQHVIAAALAKAGDALTGTLDFQSADFFGDLGAAYQRIGISGLVENVGDYCKDDFQRNPTISGSGWSIGGTAASLTVWPVVYGGVNPLHRVQLKGDNSPKTNVTMQQTVNLGPWATAKPFWRCRAAFHRDTGGSTSYYGEIGIGFLAGNVARFLVNPNLYGDNKARFIVTNGTPTDTPVDTTFTPVDDTMYWFWIVYHSATQAKWRITDGLDDAVIHAQGTLAVGSGAINNVSAAVWSANQTGNPNFDGTTVVDCIEWATAARQ